MDSRFRGNDCDVPSLASGNWRSPDVSMFEKGRLANGVIPATRADFAPDVAFEILSPGNSPSYVQRKRRDSQESGVTQVWIDPEKRFIELIYRDRPLEYVKERRGNAGGNVGLTVQTTSGYIESRSR